MSAGDESPGRIRVVIADDDPMARELLAAIIASEPSLELVGQGEDTESAVEAVLEHRPDVAVLDWVMPGGGGARAAGRIVRESPGTVVVALTAHDSGEAALDMMRAGAKSVRIKGCSPAQLIETIHAVVRLPRGPAQKPLP